MMGDKRKKAANSDCLFISILLQLNQVKPRAFGGF
jgi:hypothetical protein